MILLWTELRNPPLLSQGTLRFPLPDKRLCPRLQHGQPRQSQPWLSFSSVWTSPNSMSLLPAVSQVVGLSTPLYLPSHYSQCLTLYTFPDLPVASDLSIRQFLWMCPISPQLKHPSASISSRGKTKALLLRLFILRCVTLRLLSLLLITLRVVPPSLIGSRYL